MLLTIKNHRFDIVHIRSSSQSMDYKHNLSIFRWFIFLLGGLINGECPIKRKLSTILESYQFSTIIYFEVITKCNIVDTL